LSDFISFIFHIVLVALGYNSVVYNKDWVGLVHVSKIMKIGCSANVTVIAMKKNGAAY